MIGSVPLPVLTPAKHESADLLATGVLQPSRFRSSFKTLASPGRDTSDRPPESLAADDQEQRGLGLSDSCNGEAHPLASARVALVRAALPVAERRGSRRRRDRSRRAPAARARVPRAAAFVCRRSSGLTIASVAAPAMSSRSPWRRTSGRLAPASRDCLARGWLANPSRTRGDPSMQKRACRPAGHSEHARLSAVAGGLLRRRDGVGRREEPPRYESGFRAHGSNQRFHRLLGHAVARALTTAPSLAGLGPAAPRILIHHGWRRKRRPGRCRENHSGTWCVNWSAG